MPDWALALIALFGGIGGLWLGYLLGYRNGHVSGELRALHVTMAEMRGVANRPTLRPAKSLLARDP